MTIKMSELLELPVDCHDIESKITILRSPEMQMLSDLINAYDTNQARIAELEAEVKLLRGCNESPSVSPTITAGCYCTDIETEAQYVATCEALVKLGCLASGFYSYPDSGMCSYRDEYLINGNVGWVEPSMEISNGIYHAKGDLRHCFTTLVSHRDIIKAAEGL